MQNANECNEDMILKNEGRKFDSGAIPRGDLQTGL